MNKDDQRLVRLMCKRVGVALRHARDKRVVESDETVGQYLLWRIAR